MAASRLSMFACRGCRTSLSKRPFSTTSHHQRPDDDTASKISDILFRDSNLRPQTQFPRSKQRAPSRGSAAADLAQVLQAESPFPRDRASRRSAGAERSPAETPARNSSKPDDSNDLFGTLRSVAQMNSKDPALSLQERRAKQAAQLASRRQLVQRKRDVESFSARPLREGDIYAPYDLSPSAMKQSRTVRSRKFMDNQPLNSRKRGFKDVLDELGINPIKEYKNFALMNDFVTDTGRIKHSRQTGFRAVNQRRMAKAVRRAHGMGLLPTSHRHPELFREQVESRSRSGAGALASRY